jgi:macrocin-O-methyltransferase TylF-like protien
MKNRHELMGGKEAETFALKTLEELRQQFIDGCEYQNEKNWVASVACMNRISLSKILFYNEILSKITDIPGVIAELGVQWGATTSLLYNLSSIYEPFNFRRRVVGFDTFSGFPASSISSGEKQEGWKENDLSTADNIQETVETCLSAHQAFSAMDHMKRHEFVKGDVVDTLPRWLEENEHETIALCVFDLDLAIPTRAALEAILPRCQKGTILVFDEYSHPRFREEGVAAREYLDAMKIKPIKSPLLPYTSYFVL